MTFSQLGIDDKIVTALSENRITHPSDIQSKAIPHILKREEDLIAVAQTGTGKTAAFCLPILQQLVPTEKSIQALVIVPTRELGQQVAREFFLFSKHMPRIFTEAVYGGVPIDEQISKLRRATHVVVATPGRLLDLLNRKALSLQQLKFIVIDEADEMINMGFRSDIDEVLSVCNRSAVKLLFTATMSKEVKSLAEEFMSKNAVSITINAEEFVNQKIAHHYLIYPSQYKIDYLKALLLERKGERGIIFCRTKTDAKKLAQQLAGFEVTTDALHGNLNQEMRDKVMRGFKKGRTDALIATDIAARGIDVKELDYIIHYHLPEKSEQYVHRSGRTARAGRSGVSICFIKKENKSEIDNLSRELSIDFELLPMEVKVDNKPTPNITLTLNVGWAQGYDKNSLTDYLVEETGVAPAEIKNMVVDDERSHFQIQERYEQQIILNLKGIKLFHRNLKVMRKL